jgi:hypothetical protein
MGLQWSTAILPAKQRWAGRKSQWQLTGCAKSPQSKVRLAPICAKWAIAAFKHLTLIEAAKKENRLE